MTKKLHFIFMLAHASIASAQSAENLSKLLPNVTAASKYQQKQVLANAKVITRMTGLQHQSIQCAA